jgi:DNA (cytosine-5)-methyltransferase 1
MNYLSVCSGIEAATVAWHDLGWKPVGYSEIEPFPSAVLAHHYPNVPNFGDMTKYKEWNINETVDLIVGGTPCQSFSVAGLRKGMDDPRGNLALVYCGMLDHFRPKWFVWENVPGVLSSSGGRDFGSFLGAVAELGYGFAYRVLDAQYCGVAQRRRRIFVVGYLGDWRPPAAVLFERRSLRRDTAPSAPQGKKPSAYFESSLAQYREGDIGGTLKASGGVLSGGSETFLVQKVYENHPADSRVKDMGDICTTVTSRWGTGGGNIPFVQEVFRKSRRAQSADDFETWVNDDKANTINTFDVGDIRTTHAVAQSIGFTQCDAARDAGQDISPTLRSGGDGGYPAHSVAYPIHAQATQFKGGGNNRNNDGKGNGLGVGNLGDPMNTLDTSSRHAVATNMAVRRLTPIECERLQGFSDNYTNIPWRKKDTSPDGPRYKALGNSMAVPCMQWIGDGIDLVDKL